MPPVLDCPLCRSHLNPLSQGSDWTHSWRRLKFENGQLMPPVNASDLQSGMKYVHSACWSIVKRYLGPPEIDDEWLQCFVLFLELLAPSLHSIIPWDDPSSLEPALGEERPDDPDPNNERTMSKKYLPLPADIIHSIYTALDDYLDIENLHIATQIPPSAGVWLKLGRRFLCFDQFNSDTNEKNAAKIKRALRRLYQASSRYPRAVNYGVIWANVEAIVGRMNVVAYGHETKLDFSGRYKVFDPDPLIVSKKTTPPTGNLSVLRMEFCHIRHNRYLCGLTFHKTITGIKGDSSVVVRSQDICGLRLLCLGSSKGFEGVQIKSHTGWEDDWYGTYPPPEAHMAFTELTWVPNVDGRIFLALDAYKICNIAYADSASGPVVCPQVWQSFSPPEGYSPVILFDSGLSLQLDPADTLEDHGLRSVTAISGYINPETQHLSCMEFSVGGPFYRIGEPENPCCKLLFVLEKDETVVEIAHPATKGVFGLQFITNRSRSMVFGLGALEATRWLVRPAPDGLFFSLERSKRNPEGFELETLGIFVNDAHSAGPLRQVAAPTTQATQWKIRVVSSTKWFGDRTVFSTEAGIASISKITVIEDEGQIFGLKVFSTDPALPCQVLGYCNRFIGDFSGFNSDIQYPEKEFIIEGELISMCVHYSAAYEVVGLYLATSSGQRIDVGDVLSFPRELIRFTPTESTLYWLFDHEIDYLTLSDSDVTIRPFAGKSW